MIPLLMEWAEKLRWKLNATRAREMKQKLRDADFCRGTRIEEQPYLEQFGLDDLR